MGGRGGGSSDWGNTSISKVRATVKQAWGRERLRQCFGQGQQTADGVNMEHQEPEQLNLDLANQRNHFVTLWDQASFPRPKCMRNQPSSIPSSKLEIQERNRSNHDCRERRGMIVMIVIRTTLPTAGQGCKVPDDQEPAKHPGGRRPTILRRLRLLLLHVDGVLFRLCSRLLASLHPLLLRFDHLCG